MIPTILSFIPSMRFSSLSSPSILKIGDVLRQTRIYSNLDVLEYSKLSHDSNPLHFDPEFARNAGFEDRLVHGMLVAALFPRIISSHFVLCTISRFRGNYRSKDNLCSKIAPKRTDRAKNEINFHQVFDQNQTVGPHCSKLKVQPGAVYISQSLNFRLPVYIGDEIVGEVEATNIRELKNRYLAKFSTKCLKNGKLVIDGEATAILPTLALEYAQSG